MLRNQSIAPTPELREDPKISRYFDNFLKNFKILKILIILSIYQSFLLTSVIINFFKFLRKYR